MELAFCEGKLTINIISKLYSTLEGAKYNVKQKRKKKHRGRIIRNVGVGYDQNF